jgi:hypothetical protein
LCCCNELSAFILLVSFALNQKITMRIRTAFLIALSISIFTACTNNKEGAAEEKAAVDSLQNGGALSSIDSLQQDMGGAPSNEISVVNSGAQAAPATGKGLNPAHGEPGHRCEIAVGAPLDSKPTAAASQPNMTSQPSLSPQPMSIPSAGSPSSPPASGSVAEGTNPAHGQPGHDCAIPVGAPLKKK